MSEDELIAERQLLGPWARHRFTLLVGLVIAISLFLVGVALALYASSGAAQLDLSRPGYVSVREQATQTNPFNGFSASGSMDKATLDKFRQQYRDQATKATSVDAFGGSVMSDESLLIDNPPVDTAN